VIGIMTYTEEAQFGLVDTFAAVLPLSYVHAVHESGGRAVLITPDDPDVDILERIDGIILAGGSDVDPKLYGEPAHPTVHPRPARDTAELMMLTAAVQADLPVFGICRGMQLMAVAYGGRLYQHLPDVLGHTNHRPVTGPKFGQHPVNFAPGSRCQAILGESVTVNSYHHQGIADPGRLTAVGWSPDDGLIEAMEDPARTFVLGVQWHPEDSTDFRLFEAHVAASAARADRTRVTGHAPVPVRAGAARPGRR
jgi:putative glutamine amidotransferase